MLRKLFGEPTPDDTLADEVRRAAAAFNRAIGNARSSGLNVSFYIVSKWGGSKEYCYDRTIEIKEIERTNREKF